MDKMDEMAKGILKELFDLARKRAATVTVLEVLWDDEKTRVGVWAAQSPVREHFIEHFGEGAYREIIDIFRDASCRVSEAIRRSGKVKGVITVDAEAVRAQAAQEEKL